MFCQYVDFFRVTGAHLEPLARDLLANLFNVLSRPVSEENEYVMKGEFRTFIVWNLLYFQYVFLAMMRTFSTLQERVMPFLNVTLPKLTEKLQMVTKNPSKPHFNHYLFETFSLAIR